MIPSFVPAQSLGGFLLRTPMAAQDVTAVEQNQPGYTARQCLETQSRIYGMLRKRYAVDSLGQVVGPPSASGTMPPQIQLVGSPVRGDLELQFTVTSPGAVGVMAFSWQDNSGPLVNGVIVPVTNVLSAASVPLAGTGLTLSIPPLSIFSADNVYTSQTPVISLIQRWVTDITTPRIYRRRGVNPTNDQQILDFEAIAKLALDEVAQAANSKDGLFDLPLNVDSGGSGITQSGPYMCSQTSPYVWTDIQACRGTFEDFVFVGGEDFDG
jgi:hypothetical protein